MEKTQLDGIIDRIKSVTSIASDRKLSVWLDREVNYISVCRQRNTIDLELVLSKCSRYDIGWVLTGKIAAKEEKELSDRERYLIAEGESRVYKEIVSRYEERVEKTLASCEKIVGRYSH